jgi:hypothetical protein
VAYTYYNFEIFHMLEKQIPVDSVEIKEVIHAFAWGPALVPILLSYMVMAHILVSVPMESRQARDHPCSVSVSL